MGVVSMLLKKYEQHKIAPTNDPMLDITALSDIRAQLSVREVATTDQMFCARVVDSLPREYECKVRHFQSALTPTTLDRIEQVVRERFVSLQSEESNKKQSPGHALCAGDTASSGCGDIATAAIAVVAVEVVAEAMQEVTGVDQTLSGVAQAVSYSRKYE